MKNLKASCIETFWMYKKFSFWKILNVVIFIISYFFPFHIEIFKLSNGIFDKSHVKRYS
jgi:hypothetical protein